MQFRQSAWARYGVAVGVVLIALGLRFALVPIIGTAYPILIFFPAVTLAVWYGGTGPGLLSVALSVVAAATFFLPAFRTAGIQKPDDLVGLLLFTSTGLLITYLNQLRATAARQALDTANLLRESQEALRAAYERERRISETLQRSLLMTPAETRFQGMEVEAFYEPASNELMVGGDFFDAFALSGDKIALVVGDVSGKGLQAAAHTAEVKYALRTILREHPHPATALVRLNNVVCESQELDQRDFGRFIAVCLAVVDPKTGEGQIAMAGSEPALIVRHRDVPAIGDARPYNPDDYDEYEMEIPDINGLPLCVESKFDYLSRPLHLNLTDTMVMLTDGITEARRGKDFLGYDGMTLLAREAVLRETLHEMGQAILDGARAFAGGKLQDDACLLLARRT